MHPPFSKPLRFSFSFWKCSLWTKTILVSLLFFVNTAIAGPGFDDDVNDETTPAAAPVNNGIMVLGGLGIALALCRSTTFYFQKKVKTK